MREKSSTQQMIEEILDHPKNRNRDAHERSALARRLKRLSFAELEREFYRL